MSNISVSLERHNAHLFQTIQEAYCKTMLYHLRRSARLQAKVIFLITQVVIVILTRTQTRHIGGLRCNEAGFSAFAFICKASITILYCYIKANQCPLPHQNSFISFQVLFRTVLSRCTFQENHFEPFLLSFRRAQVNSLLAL